MSTRSAWGSGLATVAADGSTLDVWYPSPALGEPPADAEVPADLRALEREDTARGVRTTVVRTVVDLDTAPADAADAYLRLHLLSHRLVAPHGQSLDGIFGVLSNVVWTDRGPCAVAGFEATRLRLRAATGKPVTVHGGDKFPRMVDYALPTGVRIADARRVGPRPPPAPRNTPVHARLVNFHAGTPRASMGE